MAPNGRLCVCGGGGGGGDVGMSPVDFKKRQCHMSLESLAPVMSLRSHVAMSNSRNHHADMSHLK